MNEDLPSDVHEPGVVAITCSYRLRRPVCRAVAPIDEERLVRGRRRRVTEHRSSILAPLIATGGS
jgi:hypothetical protein